MNIEVGMKVKVLDKLLCANHEIGSVGVVTKVGGDIEVKIDNLTYWYRPSSLEVVEEQIYNIEVTINTIVSFPKPMSVNYINPDTVVVWDDGDVTRVKCKEGEKWDEYIGFLACLAKKVYGGHNQYKKFIKNAVQNE